MKRPFTYWLHDSYSSEEFKEVILEDQLELGFDDDGNQTLDLDDLMQKIGRPFYEVKLHCELDTETGEVTVRSVEL